MEWYGLRTDLLGRGETEPMVVDTGWRQ